MSPSATYNFVFVFFNLLLLDLVFDRFKVSDSCAFDCCVGGFDFSRLLLTWVFGYWFLILYFVCKVGIFIVYSGGWKVGGYVWDLSGFWICLTLDLLMMVSIKKLICKQSERRLFLCCLGIRVWFGAFSDWIWICWLVDWIRCFDSRDSVASFSTLCNNVRLDGVDSYCTCAEDGWNSCELVFIYCYSNMNFWLLDLFFTDFLCVFWV